MFIAAIFLFEPPKIECYNTELDVYFRCSITQACSQYRDNFREE